MEPDELGVRVRQAAAGVAALVDQGVDVGKPVVSRRRGPLLPGLGHEPELVGRELGDRAQVLRGVDDDFLAIQRGVQIRDDPDLPRVADPEGLRRGAVLVPRAERAALELVAARPSCSGAMGSPRCDRHESSGNGVAAQLRRRWTPPASR